jgi:hypothetical protein
VAYELIELSTANLVGSYDTEQEALRDVVAAIRRCGRPGVASLALGYGEPDGSSGFEIARGNALADLALTKAAA